MSEDPTNELNTDEMLRLILSRLTNVETRLSAIEAQAEDRTQTTRPLLNQLIKEMTDMRDTLTARADETNARLAALTERVTAVEKELRSTNYHLDTLAPHSRRTQGAIREHAERLAELESRPN